jgi:hypothetical protein
MSAAPKLLYVFPGFGGGGAQLRMVSIMNALGDSYENGDGGLWNQAVAGPPLRLRVAREHWGLVGGPTRTVMPSFPRRRT